MTHSEIIKARAQELANLGDTASDAVEFISEAILRTAAQRMESMMDSQDCGNYVTMFTDNTYDSDMAYHEMSASQKKLYNLESAETYYCLYFLALALKKMTKGNVFLDRYESGTEGRSLSPSSIDKIFKMREGYLEEADNIVSSVGSAGDIIIVAV
jgi:hypothetical protein